MKHSCFCGAAQRGPASKPEVRHNSETGATREVRYATCRNGHRFIVSEVAL